ncbi:sulfatase-like hydrolase/transferase [Hydrogenophaga sp.]|uniref:sulfatase-like hydrolase/transferase n=1 Tax=Hydrogenophaga sp. TaxID=1904254 RepID=UPI00271D7CA2|nr:sulfatase-like hydrolase/transferase [Hydrogenophaga sp.]MDO9437864.1 sulfatase-like hydrolase/transferase [Hydrogenophaga sp.]
MSGKNLVIIMADELSPKFLGHANHPLVKTPHLDALAAGGTRFTRAYTPSPLCMPARAAFATGRYAHETGYWDNVLAYDGRVPSWGHHLQRTGHHVATMGKLHYTGSDISSGIDEQIVPMHVVDDGDFYGLMRDDPPSRPQSAQLAAKVGAGESEYIRYDLRITELAEQWLADNAGDTQRKPWVLFVSFLAPHFPLIVPQRYIDLYDIDQIELPKAVTGEGHQNHSWWETFHACYDFDRYFRDDLHRREAIQAYLGLCSFVDDNVGRVLKALAQAAPADSTRVIFTSDHGDNLGARGLWGKSTMYEESVGIPLVMSGLGVPSGKVSRTPVSLIDLYPTIIEAVGEALTIEERSTLPGRSLLPIANAPDDAERIVFSEYHASCAKTGSFMLRQGRFKYVHFTGHAGQLFDLEADPEEQHNLIDPAAHMAVVQRFETELLQRLDPWDVDRRAKADQLLKLEQLGGRDRVLARKSPSFTPAPV